MELKKMNEDKWQFCPDKECYYCFEDLGLDEELKKQKGVITSCPRCHRSFLD